jgi:hypothetical protein
MDVQGNGGQLRRNIAMLYELVIVACLVFTPDACESKTLAPELPNLWVCIGGRERVAGWEAVYPHWTVRQWTCQPALRQLTGTGG